MSDIPEKPNLLVELILVEYQLKSQAYLLKLEMEKLVERCTRIADTIAKYKEALSAEVIAADERAKKKSRRKSQR